MPVFEITSPEGKKYRVTGPEGSTKDEALQQVMGNASQPKAETAPLKIGAEGLPDAIKQVSDEFGPLSKVAIGGAGAINKMAMRLKQIVGRDLTPQDLQGLKEYEALNQASGSAVAGDIGMNLLATAVPGVGLQAGATNLASRVLPAAAANTVGAAAAGGTMAAATEPVLEGGSTLRNAALGAAGGVAGDVAARGLARVAAPITQSPEVQKLVSEGIIPTPGQSFGSKSFIGKFEQRLESLPLVGDLITKGRNRAIEDLNKAAVNGSLPNGAQVTVTGRKAIEEAKNIFDSAYGSALAGKEVPITASKMDGAVAAVKNDPDVFLTKEAEANLDKLLEQVKRRLPQSGKLSGDTAKTVDSWLGGIAAKYNGSANAADREFGSAVLGLQKEFRTELSAAIPELKGIDSKYASFLRVQRAAGATGSKEGIFSPEALQSAVRSMDKSRNKGAFSSGDALMQDLSDPAVSVLGRSVADSGTAGRALVGAGLLGAGGAANEYYGGPGYLTALALAPMLYSRAGSRYMIGDLPGQQATSDVMKELAPYLSQLGRVSALR